MMVDTRVLVLHEVARARAEHPRAVACTICEGIEFRICRGEPDTIECLRCGREEPFVQSYAEPTRDAARVGRSLDKLNDAIDALEDARLELEG